MPYVPLNLKPGATLKAEHLAHMENGIAAMSGGSGGGDNSAALEVANEAKGAATAALAAASAAQSSADAVLGTAQAAESKADEAKTTASAAQTSAAEAKSAIDDHAASLSNPHSVTAVQVMALPAIESEDHPGCFYRMVDSELEWINPPLVPGVEYRTIERYGENTVYALRIDAGAMAAGANVIALPFSYTVYPVRTQAILSTAGGGWSISVPALESGSDGSAYHVASLTFATDAVKFFVINNYAGRKAYITIFYTK